MSHVRQQIRTALAATLTGLTTTGARVYVNRAKALATGDLPALVLRVKGERIEATGLHWPDNYDRDAAIEIEALASGATAANTLDTIIAEVESALAGSESAATAGGLLKLPVTLEAIDVEFDDEVSPAIGSATLSYRANYCTAADQPDTAI